MRSDARTIVNATVLYWYNTNPKTIMEMLFPDAHPSYIEEKIGLYRLGFTTLWGERDANHQEKFVQAALNKYGEEGARR